MGGAIGVKTYGADSAGQEFTLQVLKSLLQWRELCRHPSFPQIRYRPFSLLRTSFFTHRMQTQRVDTVLCCEEPAHRPLMPLALYVLVAHLRVAQFRGLKNCAWHVA